MSQPARDVGAVVLAAGDRPGADLAWSDFEGRPLVARAVDALARTEEVGWTVLVAPTARLPVARGMAGLDRLVACDAGRGAALAAGLAALPREASWVVVHDGAQPFVTAGVVRATIDAARRTGAAVAAVPVTDTIRRVRGERAIETLPRDRLRAAQTPLVLRRDLIDHSLAGLDLEAADEWTLLERLGPGVAVAPGDPDAFRIATAGDLEVARALAAERAARQ